MKKNTVTVWMVLFGLLPIMGAFGQQGFTGPGSDPATRSQGQLTTVAEAVKMWDDTRVTLQGTIVNQLSREKYTFRDGSGEITVEIDGGVWRKAAIEIGEADRVEIYGEVDKERQGTQIDVKNIRKL